MTVVYNMVITQIRVYMARSASSADVKYCRLKNLYWKDELQESWALPAIPLFTLAEHASVGEQGSAISLPRGRLKTGGGELV